VQCSEAKSFRFAILPQDPVLEMNVDKRIWKSGVLAAAATALFAIVVFRAADEARRGFVDIGRMRIIPQIAAGTFDGNRTKYSTTIQIVNTGDISVPVGARFHTQEGVLSTLPMTANGNPFQGILDPIPIAPGASLVIAANSEDAGEINWGRIETTESASVFAYFELRDAATNALHSRVSVASDAAGMSRFIIPRVRNSSTGLDVAFALVNTGTATTELTGTVRDASGAILAKRVISLNPGHHIAFFAAEFFNLAAEPAGTAHSSIVFSSAAAQIAAIALAIEGASLTNVPVHSLQ
jgi:hypothetical protein